MVNFYKTINEAFDKRYDSNTKKPLTEASAAHAHPDMSKKAGSISSMILSNKDRIDNATSLQDLRAVVEDILSPLEGNAKVTEINGRLRAMKDHVKALQYIYNIILKGDNLGTIKTGKAKERSKNESVRSRRVNESKRKLKEANTDWYSMDWDDQVDAIKRFVKNYRGTKVFEDFAASVGVDVDDVIDIFADLESYGIIYIPRNIQIDDKYMNNDIYESKRKLKEAASGTFNPDREYDWYEDGDVHPFLDIFDNALDELGLWSEPSIQGGNGYDYFYTQEGSKDAGGVDFGIEADFMNDLFQEMKGHSWSEIEDAIAEFVGDHAEYPDDYDEDEDEDDGGDADHDTPTLRLVKKILPKLKKYLGDAGYSCNLLVDFSTGKDVVTVHPSDSIQIDVAEIAPSDIVKAVKSSGLDINDQSISDDEWQAVFDKIITDAMTRRSGYGVIAFCSLEELSTYKGKDCSYLLEVRPGEKLLCVDVFVKSFQNGSFKEYPYMLLSYVPGVPKRNTVLGPNYRADYLQERDALKDIESKIKSIQANESFRRRRVNESARRSRTTKKKIR